MFAKGSCGLLWDMLAVDAMLMGIGLGWFGGEVRRCHVHVNLHTDTRAHTHT